MKHVVWPSLLDNILLKYESLGYNSVWGFAYESIGRGIEFYSRQKPAKFLHSL
jgi:hypothetical protein